MGKQARLRAERRPRVVEAYVRAAREILPTVFEPNCCLNGTRVCIDALAAHGVGARPMVVDLVVANALANRMFEEHGGWPEEDEVVRRWLAEGAWVITVNQDSGEDANGWPHHLVADAGDMIVDSALGAMHRPLKGIELPQVAAFHKGGLGVTREAIVWDAPDGATVGFKLRRDVGDYVRMSGWQRSRHNRAAAAKVATRMADLLGT